MQRIWGYLRTLRQYLHTEKGWHDFLDDLRAAVWMAAVMAVIWLLLQDIL